MEKNASGSRTILIQDLGLLMFMLSMLGAALITGLTEKALLYQHVALMLGMIFSALLTALRARIAGTALTAVSLLAFTAYKVYYRLAYSVSIEWTAYFWPALLLAALGGMTLFITLYSNIEGLNGILNRRLDELTVIDPVTGMENLRSMIISLKRYMALSERNGTDMGLMMVRLRYADEIKKVLTRTQFNDLRKILADAVQQSLRLEDRVFTIDEAGSLGIIYFSVVAGAPVVKQRIISVVQQQNMVPSLAGQTLNVEVSVVFREYDKSMGKDAMKFIDEVEKEFAYEV